MKLPLLLLFFLLPSSSIGSQNKPPYVSAFSNVVASLRYYPDTHDGALPKDMDEFVRSGGLSGAVREEAKRFLDFEHRYRFVNPPVEIEVNGNREAIVLIARNANEEGEGTEQDSAGKSVLSPGRLLAVRTADGNLQSRRYSEKRLERGFKAAGLDLAAYTSDCGPLPGHLTPRALLAMKISSCLIVSAALVMLVASHRRKLRDSLGRAHPLIP